jgi:hypothetical protein
MKTRKQALKKTLIINGCYILLLAALLLGITLARYQDAMVAYTSFSAASFNALIIGDINSAATLAGEGGDEFEVNVNTVGFRPGMRWSANADSTAKVISFSVANGTDEADSAEVSVEYTLRRRTSGNLPLKYTLAEWLSVPAEPEGGHYVYYDSGAPQFVENDENDSGDWYEYSFYPEGVSPVSGLEAVFELEGGSLRTNPHKLIIEWPIADGGENEPDTNSPVYMKEVELMEVIATVSSKNMLGRYENTTVPDTERVYSTGVMILHPAEGKPEGSVYGYEYENDYRSFAEDYALSADARSVSFGVENGLDKHREQEADYVHYDLFLKVPVFLKTEGSIYPQAYVYWLYTEERPEGVELDSPVYRLYDELDGSYEEYESLPTAYSENELGSEYRMYAVYKLAEDETLRNIGGLADSDAYKIALRRPDNTPVSPEELAGISFYNRLEVIAEAEFDDEAG